MACLNIAIKYQKANKVKEVLMLLDIIETKNKESFGSLALDDSIVLFCDALSSHVNRDSCFKSKYHLD